MDNAFGPKMSVHGFKSLLNLMCFSYAADFNMCGNGCFHNDRYLLPPQKEAVLKINVQDPPWGQRKPFVIERDSNAASAAIGHRF